MIRSSPAASVSDWLARLLRRCWVVSCSAGTLWSCSEPSVDVPAAGSSSGSEGKGHVGSEDGIGGSGMVLDTDATDSTGIDDSDSTSTTSPALDSTTASTTDAPPPFCDQTDCDDHDPCTVDTCDPDTETCLHDLSPGLACDDANACTTDDTCQPDGTCAGTGLCTVEHCGEINNDEVWGPDVIHHLTCSVNVRGPESPTLTILDGTLVEADPSGQVRAGNTQPGRLDIQGGELGVLFTSSQAAPLPGDWGGLVFGGDDAGSTVAGATIEYAGNGEAGAIVVEVAGAGSPEVHVTDSIIRDTDGHGIYVSDNFATVVIEGSALIDNAGDGVSLEPGQLGGPFADNVVTGNGGAPLRLSADEVAMLDASSTYAGNGEPAVVAYSTVLESGTWQLLDVDYHVFGGGVSAWTDPVTLTIEPGVTIVAAAPSPTWFEVSGPASIQALGTAESPIRLIDVSLMFELSAINPSLLQHVIVEGGEGVEAWNGSSQTGPGSLTITNSVIRNTTGSHALLVDPNAALTLTGTVIEDNAGIGLQGGGLLSSLGGNAFLDNGGVAMLLFPDAVGLMDVDQVIAGNDPDAVELASLILSAPATWPALPVPYRIAGDQDLIVLTDEGGTLTLEAGAVLEFEPGASMQVGATYPPDVEWYAGLVLAGEPGNPVVLRSTEPTASPGEWQGLRFSPQALPSQLEHCVIQHAGGAPYQGAVVVEVDGIAITNCTISDSASYGIYQDGANATLSGNTFTNNADGGVYP